MSRSNGQTAPVSEPVRSIIDTNIAIQLRDRDEAVIGHLECLTTQPMISVVTLVELEGGVHKDPRHAARKRAGLDLLLESVEVLPFTPVEAEAYGEIVGLLGFSRRMIIDRMIAATAIVAKAMLITANPADFRQIRKLDVESWAIGEA